MVMPGLPVIVQRNLTHAPVVSGIGAVDIARKASAKQRMIQTRVEFHPALFRPAGKR